MTDTTTPPKRKLTLSREAATTVADIVGLLLVCGGVAAIYWPAALILAGLAVLAASWIAAVRPWRGAKR